MVTACDKYGNKLLYYNKYNERQPINDGIWLNCTSSASISTGYTYLRGQAGDDDCPQEDSLLEHRTTFRIDGKTDAAVPLVELAKGAQLLLVEAEKNAALKAAHPELRTYDYNGKTYYMLDQAGTYTGVWLSGADGKFVYADTVSVSGGTGDRTYDIRVYIPKGSDNTKLSLKYLTLIRTEGAPKSELNGIVWGGDHQARRLTDFYNHVWLNYELKKEIVDTASASAEGKSTSAVEAGQQVIYRIGMGTSNEKQGSITLKGSQIRDILPKSLAGTFAWEKGTNVAVSYEIPEDQEYEIQGGDSWSITADTSDANQQILTWGDDFSLTFGDKPVYIYVTLTYPDGEAWEKYSEAYAAAILVNTAETLGMTSSVTHALKITGKAVVQQGVIRSYQAFGDFSWITCSVNSSGTDSRWVYSTAASRNYLVDYYVAIKNDGKTKLYLSTLQCVLPKGFYFYQDFYHSDGVYYTNYSSYECATEIGTGKTESRINGQIKVSGGGSTSDGRRRVNISFFKGPTDHYDSSCGLYYLNPGETLQFSYTCSVKSWENTAETASCTIAMPYYDAAEAGVQLGESRYAYRTNDGMKPNDDPNPSMNTNTWAADNGFYTEDQKEDTSWLSSTVTMYRGKTELGLEKTLASTSNSSAGRPSSATNQETLNWVIKATNSGTSALEDYVLTDVMDAPYEITGGRLILKNSSFSSSNNKVIYAYMDIPAIRYDKDTGNVTYGKEVLPKDGTAKTISEYLYNYTYRDYNNNRNRVDIEVSYVLKDGAPVISFRFKDTLMAITAHGEAELCLSTKKPDGLQNVNQTYVNTAWLTPLKDGIWDETATIGMLDRTLETAFWDEPRTSIRSSANIVVTYGYSTASTLEALQTYDGKSFSASSDAAAVTVLPDKNGTIHYTMTVDNTVYQMPADLTKLVLINNLPEPGDHTTFQESDLRGSEYQIDLAEDPNFQVTVTVVDLVTKEETKKVLESNQYHIEYTKETSFDTADWNGTEDRTKWTTDPTGARSFRIVIDDATGATMPKHSKITVEYDAKVDNPDSVKPGQIANNSFGYHYEVKNGSTTIPLEAAPMGVGLRTPYVPTLQKQLENSEGEEMTAAGDTTFRFVIYSGQELTLRNGFTQDDLAEALQNRSFTVAEASVKAGQSASEAAWLSSQVNYTSDGNVMTPTTIAWEWKDKTTYHIIEIPARNGYEYASINHSSSADYSFTYNYTNKNTLQCVNIGIGWNMQLTKIREGHEDIKLQDAYFALYSKEQAEQITYADYKALTVAKKPAKTLFYEDTTWYLKSVDKTGADGTLTWTDMTENDYLYVEVQAPNGYVLDGTVHKVSRPTDGETALVTAANRLYYKLPSTGGSGTRPYQAAGLALMAIALGLWLKKRRTRALGFFKRFW